MFKTSITPTVQNILNEQGFFKCWFSNADLLPGEFPWCGANLWCGRGDWGRAMFVTETEPSNSTNVASILIGGLTHLFSNLFGIKWLQPPTSTCWGDSWWCQWHFCPHLAVCQCSPSFPSFSTSMIIFESPGPFPTDGVGLRKSWTAQFLKTVNQTHHFHMEKTGPTTNCYFQIFQIDESVTVSSWLHLSVQAWTSQAEPKSCLSCTSVAQAPFWRWWTSVDRKGWSIMVSCGIRDPYGVLRCNKKIQKAFFLAGEMLIFLAARWPLHSLSAVAEFAVERLTGTVWT